jgi:hypothetical protein
MIHVGLPTGAPMWLVGIFLASALLVGLVRALLPQTPAERLDWWKSYWQYRRALRRDRWRRHEQRRAERHALRPLHAGQAAEDADHSGDPWRHTPVAPYNSEKSSIGPVGIEDRPVRRAGGRPER